MPVALTLYDLDSGEVLTRISPDMALAADGRLLLRMSESTAVEMENGRLHFVSHWSLAEDGAAEPWEIFP